MPSIFASKKYGVKATSTAPKIRVETITVKPTSQSSKPRSSQSLAISKTASRISKSVTRTPDSGSDSSARLQASKRLVSRKRSPAMRRIESDSDDDDDSSSTSFEFSHVSKKVKRHLEGLNDMTRDLRAIAKFSSLDQERLINAASVASLNNSMKIKFAPAFNASADEVEVRLQYPGSSRRERFELVFHKEEFEPVEEIMEVTKTCVDFFLSEEQAVPFTDPQSGIYRRLERAKGLNNIAGFKEALEAYNAEMKMLYESGAIKLNLKKKHQLPYPVVHKILRQVYNRVGAPQIGMVKKYENGTDFVYGELLSELVYDILVETGMTSKQVFVDLGSGIGNVVLQAALQIGCESWGGEIMSNACTIADEQKQEFEARCRLWGLAPGAVHLERGDFMANDNIREALKRADVVLVNNEVFTPQLNSDLLNLFLDLKDGCQIVSLKSFVPHNHKITSYNLNNPANLLDVRPMEYGSNSVSWKNGGGSYFISTKDSTRLQKYGHLS